MNSLFFSTATAETGRKSPMHCPSCRCQQQSPFRQTANIYLSPNCPSNENLAMTFNPMRSLFSKTTPTLQPLRYSPNKFNIRFCYTSPICLKKHHSSQSRFNTKRFKQAHFPHLKEKDMKQEPVLQILKNKGKSSQRPKCINSVQSEQERCNVLKMNRMKGLKRSNNNISSNNSRSLHAISKTNSLNQQLPSDLNQEEILPQEETPIDFFKMQSRLKEYELQANSKQSKEELMKSKNKSEERPSVKSIDVFKVQQKVKEGISETSFKIQETKQVKQWDNTSSDRDIASTLSEELGLNYDYYVLHELSDRSLSLNIEL